MSANSENNKRIAKILTLGVGALHKPRGVGAVGC